MLYGFSIWWVILPLFAAQYALAIFCLTRLAICDISLKKYMVWNLVCLLVFFVGSFAFLIYFYTHKNILVKKPDQTQDVLINDDNLNNNTNTVADKIDNTVADNTNNVAVNIDNTVVDNANSVADNDKK